MGLILPNNNDIMTPQNGMPPMNGQPIAIDIIQLLQSLSMMNEEFDKRDKMIKELQTQVQELTTKVEKLISDDAK